MAYIVKNVSNWNLQNKCFCQKFPIQNVCVKKLSDTSSSDVRAFRDRGLLHTSKVVFQWPQPLGLAGLVWARREERQTLSWSPRTSGALLNVPDRHATPLPRCPLISEWVCVSELLKS